jgi:hypothetical protein
MSVVKDLHPVGYFIKRDVVRVPVVVEYPFVKQDNSRGQTGVACNEGFTISRGEVHPRQVEVQGDAMSYVVPLHNDAGGAWKKECARKGYRKDLVRDGVRLLCISMLRDGGYPDVHSVLRSLANGITPIPNFVGPRWHEG